MPPMSSSIGAAGVTVDSIAAVPAASIGVAR
jgi:hypothetical protein